jgi:2-octaprenyl-6-methoxyphenol hydroxylase
MQTSLDVLIVGGGLVGLSLAAALAETFPARCIGLVEAQLPPASAPTWDERCIALNDGSRQVLARFGLWAGVMPQTAPILSTHISERGRFGQVRFSAQDAGLPALGYNTPLRALGDVLLARVRRQVNVQLLTPVTLTALRPSATQVEVELRSPDGATRTLCAGLLLAADGAQSTVRSLLGLQAHRRDYAQSALVTAVRVQRDPAGVAYERFTPDGPFALLPKPRLPDDPQAGHPCSLIWTLPPEQAAAKAALPDADFLRAAAECFGERVGRFLAVGRRIQYPLTQSLHDHQPVARTVFCGNAAQALHPVAAQGFNLALRDVAGLLDWLAAADQRGEDAGSAECLARYADIRRHDRQATADFTDQLVRLFSNRLPVLQQLRHWGLTGLELAAPLKQRVLRQNLGHQGLVA